MVSSTVREPVDAPIEAEQPAKRTGRTGVWIDRIGVVALVALGVALRFIARSPLWLDEALTVNIAKLPLGHIGPWLRHDGHPPLYYWMLHGWISVFGTGNTAVRALSGIFGLAALPLVWLAGRRLAGRKGAWVALTVTALCPYAIRYSTEARMYALVMALVLALWLVGSDALRQPRWWRLGAVTLLTAALFWSHYWAMWLIGAVTILLIVRAVIAHRGDRRAERDSTLKVIGALVVGGVLFLPWVPTLLYQSLHTGTPWAKPALPTQVVSDSLADIGGGGKPDNVVLGWMLLILVLLALFGRLLDRRRIELDVRTQPEARPAALIIVGTILLASGFMWVTRSGFQSRYDAVWVPLFLLLAALGAMRFGGPAYRRGVLAVVLLLCVVGATRVSFTHTRSESGLAASRIVQLGKPGDLVVTCPDQLGPSLERALPDRFAMGTYPDLASPKLINWVDYQRHLDKASPQRFADEVLRRAGGHNVFLAWSGSYSTHEGICEQVVMDLAAGRPGGRQILADDGGYFEHEAVMFYPPAPAK